MDHSSKTADFGFDQVGWAEKSRRVRAVFDSVAGRYDLMNDLMSGGAHRLWKRYALSLTGLQLGQRALDLASGTGDLLPGLSRQVGAHGLVLHTDINAAMLNLGRDRAIDRGLISNVLSAQVNAELLPFADDTFDCVTIAFGLRNITDKDKALAAMRRVLKIGGRVVVLEFSKPVNATLGSLYDRYSFELLPRLGQWVTGDADSYRYLAESIRRHPDQEALKSMMETVGFKDCQYHNLMGGIVAIHRGWHN